MKTNDIKNRWEQFRKQKGYLQRLDPEHPMDIFIGISEKGLDEIVLFTMIEPAQIKSSKDLEIEKGQRQDGKWATQISLKDKTNEDIFARLCLDLVEVSQNVASEKDGINTITKRFLAWQKLFSSLHTDLPKSVLKGLVGELIFARDVLSKQYSWDDIIAAWLGPDGADRDYVFPNNWFEIKAVATGKEIVTISSLNQLETDVQGYLVKINVDESNEMDPSANAVSSVINSIRLILQNNPVASQLLEQKLISVGYIDKKVYDDIYFAYKSPVYYLVNDSFPKLTTPSVPREIIGARYDLSLVGIEPWRREESNIWS